MPTTNPTFIAGGLSPGVGVEVTSDVDSGV